MLGLSLVVALSQSAASAVVHDWSRAHRKLRMRSRILRRLSFARKSCEFLRVLNFGGWLVKVLVVCDHGNNRSVTIAGQLKYWKHDVISVGLETMTDDTLLMLLGWCDRVITTEAGQFESLSDLGLSLEGLSGKHQLWDIGPDVYPRPYNPELLKKVKALMQEHKAEYKGA